MNVMITTDLEGISGVDSIEMVLEVGTEGNRLACERLMLDTNAAAQGAFDAGADRVYVIDGHAGGNNFIQGMLDPRVEELKSPQLVPALMETVDALMVVGLHAMPGTINGFLDHVQSSRSWYNYYINGRKSGELAQEAIFAAAYGVPLVMVSGDEAACVEARQFLGDISCAVVKYGVGRNRARLIDSDEALSRIRAAARDGMALVEKIRPYMPLLPMELRLELYRTDMCDALVERNHEVERLDARTVRKIVSKVTRFGDLCF